MITSDLMDFFVEKFPNGEKRISVAFEDSFHFHPEATITFKYETDSDLMDLFFIKKHIDERYPTAKITLRVHYFPYSRMDRVEGTSLIFTLKHVAAFINSLNFNSVYILEPHSHVAPALIDRNKIGLISADLLKNASIFENFNPSKDVIYFPDLTAEKRYAESAIGWNVLTGVKKRNFTTGEITDLKIVGNVPAEPFNVIMIDDLCSKGGTFIMGAKKLIDLGAKKIVLCVAHCENTIFKGEIPNERLIDAVYTTDSILDFERTKEPCTTQFHVCVL